MDPYQAIQVLALPIGWFTGFLAIGAVSLLDRIVDRSAGLSMICSCGRDMKVAVVEENGKRLLRGTCDCGAFREVPDIQDSPMQEV